MKMCVASIGTILGIIMGLYLKSIAFFVFLISFIFLLLIFTCKKVFIKKNITLCLIFLVCILIFYLYVGFLESKYNRIYQYDNDELKLEAIVVTDAEKQEYKDVYTIKVLSIEALSNNLQENSLQEKSPQEKNERIEEENKLTSKDNKISTKLLLYIKKNSNSINQLNYGDKVEITGIYEKPEAARNEGGFDYSIYLKEKEISGIITAKSVKVIENNKIGLIQKCSHDLKKNLIEKIREVLPEKASSLCIGLILGDKSYISEEVQDSFRQSNLSHMLAISGAHVSYILLGITNLFQFLKVHKRWGNVLVILFLVFFMMLVGFTPSVTRACIMCILTLASNIFFTKPNVYTSLAISSIIILLINPYYLLDIGFQLSFGGTIGIILLMNRKLEKKNIESEDKKNITNKVIEENKEWKSKILSKIFSYIKPIAQVSISANLIILPIMVYHFNTISLTFIISNLLASPILAVSLIGSMIFIFLLLVFKPLAVLISFILSPILELLTFIAKITGKLPFSQILIPTPNMWQILLYYLFLILYKSKNQISELKNKFSNKSKIKPIITFIKLKKIILILVIFLILAPYFIKFPMSNLSLKFIDVGQGDSTLIETPSRKTILIDGGGSEVGSFDVGEKTLLPFLLDNNIMQIDYMLFSHLDTDHCGRATYIVRKNKSKKYHNF